MPYRALMITLVTTFLALPTLAQEAAPADSTKPVIILPAPAEADANLQTTPETVKPTGGTGCSHGKAVTS